jgi:DNA polymerase III delta prime subunit
MQSLVDKYQPETLAAFNGLKRPKALLSKLADKPFSSAWLLVGASGLGKTTMGLALQKQMGGQLHHIASRQCDLETVNNTLRNCHYKPMFGDWNFVLVDEADQMTKPAQLAFLSALDATGFPPQTVFVFTANDTAKLEDRFLSRCRVVEFSSDDIDMEELLRYIWSQEAMNAPAPDYSRIAKSAAGNVRTAIMNLELELLMIEDAPKPATRTMWIDHEGAELAWEAIQNRLATNDFSGITFKDVAA